MIFPKIRMRSRRASEDTRRRYRETPSLTAKDLVIPIFVKEGIAVKKEIKSMPGVFQLPLKDVVLEAKKIYALGIPAVILFGIPKHKDEIGSAGYDPQGIVQKAISLIKSKVPGLIVIADVCMCEYTSHGHCGIVKSGLGIRDSGFGFYKPRTPNTEHRTLIIDNEATIKILAKIALSYAQAGADIVAPSAMMDGQVKAIKEALVKSNYRKIKIMSYSAKYASGLYNPFRDAAESSPFFGDRKTYQMDYYNSYEAVLESKLDIKEGADILMVKPALGYEDIIYRIKEELHCPLACYSVSGEYAMIKAYFRSLGKNKKQKSEMEKDLVLEFMTGFKRAGADIIITYYAVDIAKWLKNK